MRWWIRAALFLIVVMAWLALGATAWAQPEIASQEVSDNGPDVLFLAAITTGSLIGAALLGLVLYLVRLRIGFWLHRPPPRQSSGDAEHH